MQQQQPASVPLSAAPSPRTQAAIDSISRDYLPHALFPLPNALPANIPFWGTVPLHSDSPSQPAPPPPAHPEWTLPQSTPSQPQTRAPSQGGGGGGGDVTTMRSQTSTPPLHEVDPIAAFLSVLPKPEEGPARQAMWTELIRLKTRSLELQIAEARQREKEAQVELEKLRSAAAGPAAAYDGLPGPTGANVPPQPHSLQVQQQQQQQQQQAQPQAPMQNQVQQHPQQQQPALTTPINLEALLQQADMDQLFNWLPDFGDAPNTTINTYDSAQPPSQLPSIDPSTLFAQAVPGFPLSSSAGEIPQPVQSSPSKRGHSPASSSSDLPVAKRSKRSNTKEKEKKLTLDRAAACQHCSAAMGRIIVRGPKSSIREPVAAVFACLACRPMPHPEGIPDPTTSGGAIGTVELRKRVRSGIEEMEADAADAGGMGGAGKRVFCDVCQRVVGSGRVVGGKAEKEGEIPMGHLAEVICGSCDVKYQRCTDCGGGGGPRIGIGKWRMKQMFQPGRKTCSLSHNRLGDRPRSIGVHVTPTDFTPSQLKEVLARCKALWDEKTLARQAVPEMLEIDLPAHLVNPLQSFDDVQEIVKRNWPSREAMIRAQGVDGKRFKRLLGLTWAHSKPRRNVRTVDLEEEFAQTAEGEDEDDMSTVLDNVKRTNMVIPPGSDLIGMWGGEWDMQQGSLLISTLIPFEGADGDDSTALSVGEMISKVQNLQQTLSSASAPIAQVEHLWVVSGGTIPLVRERIADILIRKRSFVHVEEYLTRHPDFIHAIKARPCGLHPDLHSRLREEDDGCKNSKPLILVRWLGKDFDAKRIWEIKQQEFGGKGRRARGRR